MILLFYHIFLILLGISHSVFPTNVNLKSFSVEINAHPGSSIQDIAYHNNHLYTASGDTTVKVWSIK